MCGICGIAAGRGGAPDPDALAAMSATLVHRGPDDDGQVVAPPVGLAARRLSIIDLAGGHQPIANEDGRVHVVQNGEIYNHEILHRELAARGHEFRTRCDTEAIVHLYEEHGDGFAERLRGMFAVAIWDGRANRLVLARDRFGIKPLFYWETPDGGLAFASELKALMALPGFPREIDMRGLESLLAFNSIPRPLTIFEGVRKLEPGHLLSWTPDGDGVEVKPYARPAPEPVERLRSERAGELATELRGRLRDSVRAHLIADVPVGVLLSGGVDSATLAALAAQESSERVRTFSIGFRERSFDELERARLVARRYDTDHHELIVEPDVAELLTRLAEVFDEPLADSSAVPTYLVSQLASQHVKVAMSGEGGDELFGGYYTYVADTIAPWAGRPAAALRPLIERLPSSSARVSFDYKAKRFARGGALPPLERHHAWKEIFSPELRAELLAAPPVPGFDPLDVYRERYAATAGAEPLARLQDVDRDIYLVDDLLVKTDRASMAHSLEVRVPFLDTAVTDLALAVPSSRHLLGWQRKRLLRRAVAPLLPKRILYGRKRGFSIPAAAWLRGELLPFARDVLSPDAIRRQGLFRPEAVERLLSEHASGETDHSRQLWCLMTLGLWLERYGARREVPYPLPG
jgi:asparagine synthase (glutamine-hydrolysing)